MSNITAIILILIIVIAGFLFYWYEYRPSTIRIECQKIAIEEANIFYDHRAKEGHGSGYYKRNIGKGFYLMGDYENKYKQCLRSQGLEE